MKLISSSKYGDLYYSHIKDIFILTVPKRGFVVEYDDGKPIKLNTKIKNDRIKLCTPRGRGRGFYLRLPDGTEKKIPIGFMRVSEMKHLENLLNETL